MFHLQESGPFRLGAPGLRGHHLKEGETRCRTVKGGDCRSPDTARATKGHRLGDDQIDAGGDRQWLRQDATAAAGADGAFT